MSVTQNEKKVKRKLIDDEIDDLKKRKLDLETCIETLKQDIEKRSFEAERRNDLTLLLKANSFRKTAAGKVASITLLDKSIAKFRKKRKIWIWTEFNQISEVLILARLYEAFHHTNRSMFHEYIQ